jgi:hypothetical protein
MARFIPNAEIHRLRAARVQVRLTGTGQFGAIQAVARRDKRLGRFRRWKLQKCNKGGIQGLAFQRLHVPELKGKMESASAARWQTGLHERCFTFRLLTRDVIFVGGAQPPIGQLA